MQSITWHKQSIRKLGNTYNRQKKTVYIQVRKIKTLLSLYILGNDYRPILNIHILSAFNFLI